MSNYWFLFISVFFLAFFEKILKCTEELEDQINRMMFSPQLKINKCLTFVNINRYLFMNIYMKKRKRQKREKEEKRKRGKEQTQQRHGQDSECPRLVNSIDVSVGWISCHVWCVGRFESYQKFQEKTFSKLTFLFCIHFPQWVVDIINYSWPRKIKGHLIYNHNIFIP